jgi:hypothetical protein
MPFSEWESSSYKEGLCGTVDDSWGERSPSCSTIDFLCACHLSYLVYLHPVWWIARTIFIFLFLANFYFLRVHEWIGFLWCHNKIPHIRWLKTVEINSHSTVLEARSPRPRCQLLGCNASLWSLPPSSYGVLSCLSVFTGGLVRTPVLLD